MSPFALILPVLMLAGIIWFFVRWLRAEHYADIGVLSSEMPVFKGRRLRPDHIHFGLDRADAAPIIVITAVMAVVSFWGLGSRDAPERFFRFTDGTAYTIDLGESETVTGFEYYTGLWEGGYTVEFSQNGETWYDPYETTQSYAELFRWRFALPPEEHSGDKIVVDNCRYVRITADRWPIELGEIAVLGEDGTPLDASGFTYPAEIAALFDEQSLVPAEMTYLNSTYFDEIYHARTAYEHYIGVNPYEISHPPLGKIILMIGIWLFGMNPFGWRVMGTLFGVILLPVMYAFLKRMFGRRSIAVFGTLLMAFEFMRYTQSRIATIDTYVVLWITLMYLFMYRWFTSDYEAPFKKTAAPLALSGLFFGLGAATKWTALYAGAGLLVLYFLTLALRARYLHRQERTREFWPYLFKALALALLMFIIVPGIIYCLSYIPYAVEGKKYSLSLVWDNQKFMFGYHTGVTQDHPYASRWYQWLIDQRPILYYLSYAGDNFRSSFAAFDNPLLSWSGLIALVALCVRFFKTRDKRILFIGIAFLAQLAPWMFITRPTFAYHYYPCMVFIVLALSYMANRLETLQVPRRRAMMWGFCAAAGLLFCLFYPVISGVTIPEAYATYILRWMPSWPF